MKVEIIEEIKVLSERDGWRKELNLVSFDGKYPKHDIREWSIDHKEMGEGISLSDDEMENLIEAIEEKFL